MNRIIDLHAHPSLKIYYLPFLAETFHAVLPTGWRWNPFAFLYQYKNLKPSGLKVVLCAHYVVERGFLKHGIKPHSQAFLWATGGYFYWRMRQAEPWITLNKMMDTLERSAKNTNRWVLGPDPRLRIVRSFDELQKLSDREIALVHTIEGPHVFGEYPAPGLSAEAYWTRTRQRLDQLKERGVASITLGHFWQQPFAPQTDGTELIPKIKDQRVVVGRDDALFQMQRADWRWGGYDGLGEKLVRAMLEIGVIPDLAHVQEEARYAIYDLCAEYRRPVVLSHVGLRHFYPHEYNLSDAELKRVRQLGGVIGLVISKRLIVDPIRRYGAPAEGIADLVQNMLHIRKVVGDVSCIGLGTDFDGLTHPFQDCYHPGHLPRIVEAMKEHFDAREIEAITYGNAWRVLKNGWNPLAPKKPQRKPKI